MSAPGKLACAMVVLSALFIGRPVQAIADYKPPGCITTSPYDTTQYKAHRFVWVAPDVRLEVLDWGGSGEAMVLLTGSCDNAHVFDYFAFQFTDSIHVVGITRRGWLPSSQPASGYDAETKATDDIKVLDALGIKKAIFVGHSIAGAELSRIALKYPRYVDKLVYLDASDLSERSTFPDIPSPFPLFSELDARSLFALQAAYARLLAVREPIPAICLSFRFDKHRRVYGYFHAGFHPGQIIRGCEQSGEPANELVGHQGAAARYFRSTDCREQTALVLVPESCRPGGV